MDITFIYILAGYTQIVGQRKQLSRNNESERYCILYLDNLDTFHLM